MFVMGKVDKLSNGKSEISGLGLSEGLIPLTRRRKGLKVPHHQMDAENLRMSLMHVFKFAALKAVLF